MRRRKIRCLLAPGICAFFLCTGAFAAFRFTGSGTKQLILELPSGYVYGTEVKESLQKQKAEGISIALWREEKGVTITNPEFNRSISLDAVALAGDSPVLFPYGNALVSGEEGYCILGKHAALQLFGSTKVSGKTVLIKGKAYQVAGIEFDRPDIFVYELSADEDEALEYAGIIYGSRSEKFEKLRRLQNYFGVSE